MGIINGNEQNFADLISKDVVLVDFFASWCGPCKMLSPVLEELASERSGVKIVKLNIDENPKLTKEYGVMSVPTLMLFKDGQLLDVKNGYMPKEMLTDWLSNEKYQ